MFDGGCRADRSALSRRAEEIGDSQAKVILAYSLCSLPLPLFHRETVWTGSLEMLLSTDLFGHRYSLINTGNERGAGKLSSIWFRQLKAFFVPLLVIATFCSCVAVAFVVGKNSAPGHPNITR